MCKYQHWSRESGAMVDCGEPTDSSGFCAFHAAWIADCVQVRGRVKRTREIDWLQKARTAYGVKRPAWNGIPFGLPSDAGCNYIYGRRVGKAVAA